MKNILTSILISIAVTACNNAEQQTNNSQLTNSDSINQNTTTQRTDSTITGCFAQIIGRDTATMQLDAKGITITGPLTYDFHEKDRNEGTLQAEMTENDILTGWYLFRSEGTMSVRQLAWKVMKNELWPAVGEMQERNDSLVFVNADKLSFDSTHAFVKNPCVL